MSSKILTFTLNGETIRVVVEPTDMLADVLRDKLNLIGVKKGCGQGECGACTVIMNGDAVTSCIIPALKAEGAVVETIEASEVRANTTRCRKVLWILEPFNAVSVRRA